MQNIIIQCAMLVRASRGIKETWLALRGANLLAVFKFRANCALVLENKWTVSKCQNTTWMSYDLKKVLEAEMQTYKLVNYNYPSLESHAYRVLRRSLLFLCTGHCPTWEQKKKRVKVILHLLLVLFKTKDWRTNRLKKWQECSWIK